MEDIIKLYKSQLENSSSQLENIFSQFIPISININDLVNKYANINNNKKRIARLNATMTILRKN